MSQAETDDSLIQAIRDRADQARFAILEINDREIKSPELRRIVLREMRLFTDYVIEVVTGVRDRGVVVNEEWLERLAAMHDTITEVHGAVVRNGQP